MEAFANSLATRLSKFIIISYDQVYPSANAGGDGSNAVVGQFATS